MRRSSRAVFLGPICVIAIALAPGQSSAIEPDAETIAPPLGAVPIAPPRSTAAPRLRFGIGGAGALTSTPLLAMALGPYVKVGVQATEIVGAYAHVSATTSIGSFDLRGALLVDFTFANRVSIGTGASAQAYFVLGGDPVVLVGAPIHFAVYNDLYEGARRRAFVFTLDGDLGVAIGRFEPSSHNEERRFGAAVMLGMGYEVF